MQPNFRFALALTLLAGTVAGATACGPRRAGFWNRNKTPAPQPETQAIAKNDPNPRASTYYTTAGRSGLASNTSASIDQTLAAESSFRYGLEPGDELVAPRQAINSVLHTNYENETAAAVASNTTAPAPRSAPAKTTQVASNTAQATPTVTQPAPRPVTNAPAPVPVAAAPSPMPSPVTSQAPSEQPNYAALQPEPLPQRTTPTPVPHRSEDLSAVIYASAMGAELPTEFAPRGELTRATLNVRQVTASFAGADFDPTPTPDGKSLVFSSTQHRPTADIYIKPINASVVTRLTDDPAQDVMPAVSPDGQYIAFCSDRNGSWDIFVMPIDGGKAVQLTSDPSHDLHPTWSPDGTRLAFCRLGQQTGRWEMWVADVSAVSSAQFIGFGLFPQWCPAAGTGANGADQIMFQRSRERGDRAFSVWTLDYQANPGTAGRETEIATAPGSALINPSWSPDGRFVSFAQVPYSQAWASGASAKPESSVLWMMAVDGTGKVKLTDGKSIDLMPTWSRHNEIFFVSNMGGAEHLWSMELTPAIRAAAVQIPDLQNAFVNAPSDSN